MVQRQDNVNLQVRPRIHRAEPVQWTFNDETLVEVLSLQKVHM
jgi:hypothetical protein